MKNIKIVQKEMSLNGDPDLTIVERIQPLWVKQRNYHCEKSTYFSEVFAEMDFKKRISKIFKESSDKGGIKIDIAIDEAKNKEIGYCISSIQNGRHGEIDSLFLEQEYRNSGIGKMLMNNSLKWMKENHIEKVVLSIAVGNEEVLEFYKKFNFYPRLIELEMLPKNI